MECDIHVRVQGYKDVAVLGVLLFSLASNKDQVMKILDEQLHVDLAKAKSVAPSPGSELD